MGTHNIRVPGNKKNINTSCLSWFFFGGGGGFEFLEFYGPVNTSFCLKKKKKKKKKILGG